MRDKSTIWLLPSSSICSKYSFPERGVVNWRRCLIVTSFDLRYPIWPFPSRNVQEVPEEEEQKEEGRQKNARTSYLQLEFTSRSTFKDPISKIIQYIFCSRHSMCCNDSKSIFLYMYFTVTTSKQ